MTKKKTANGQRNQPGRQRQGPPVAVLTLPPSSRNYPMPSTYRTRLVYATTVSLDASTGGVAWSTFRANSLFDPLFAVGGHQPYGYDQMQAIYSRYVVISATVVFTVVSNQSLPLCIGAGTFNAPGYTSNITDIESLRENPRIKTQMLSDSGNRKVATVRERYHITSMYGVSVRDAVGSQFLSASTGANPTSTGVFGVCVAAQATGDDPTQIPVQVRITYDAIFSAPNVLAKS